MAKGMPREVKRIIRKGEPATVLAEEGFAEDWAAYVENEYTRALGNDPDVVHDHGDKMSPLEAAEVFPEWQAGPLAWRR